MARPRVHSVDELLDVAEQIVTSGDPAGLTLRGLAHATGAPNGTIYHAFSSKDELLARLWLRAWDRLGNEMRRSLGGPEAAEPASPTGADAIVAVALAPVAFARNFPASARLFFAQRRDQLFSADLPADLAADLEAFHKRFVDLLIVLAMDMWERGDRHAVDAVAVCVVDLPTGVLRRRVVAGLPVEGDLIPQQIESAVRAVLSLPLPPRATRPDNARSSR